MRHLGLIAVFLAFSAFAITSISVSQSLAQSADTESHTQSDFVEELRPEPEDYVEPNWQNLARMYWALGMLDRNNDVHVDNFLLLTECEMYTTYKKNEMEWADIREASKKSLIQEAMKSPTLISVFIPLELGQYNVEGEYFDVKKAESGVDEARVIKTEFNRRNQGTCGKGGNIEGYPPNLILVLNRPFSLPRVPMERELARLFLSYIASKAKPVSESQRLKAQMRMKRNAYLEFLIRIHGFSDIVILPGMNYHAQVFAEIERIRVFADPKKQTLLYDEDIASSRRVNKKKRTSKSAIEKAIQLPDGPILGEPQNEQVDQEDINPATELIKKAEESQPSSKKNKH